MHITKVRPLCEDVWVNLVCNRLLKVSIRYLNWIGYSYYLIGLTLQNSTSYWNARVTRATYILEENFKL